ncbi:DUF6461 domain-containing protein [Herbidospora daliensis]|uniref:DUF6461 domain-containing protein n=1 Tax=Herbidospora daliensis TaxID=295585 RepID=UPI00078627F7|nr:DUF6461 domain-containing protein [Herbidospora daliensis]
MSDVDFTPLRVTHRTLGRDVSDRIRAWAKDQGHPVSERGRVAQVFVDAFLAAHPEVWDEADTYELVHATARTPGPSPDDYAWESRSELGDVYTVVFVRDLDEHETLRRLGAADADIRQIDVDDHTYYPEGPQIVTVRRIGGWTVAVEDFGWRGSEPETLSALSRDGGEAVSVLRHDYAHHRLSYAVDGHVVTALDPGYPVRRSGTDPGRLDRHLRELGVDPAADDSLDNAHPMALALASRVTGVVITPADLRRPVLGAAIRTDRH